MNLRQSCVFQSRGRACEGSAVGSIRGVARWARWARSGEWAHALVELMSAVRKLTLVSVLAAALDPPATARVVRGGWGGHSDFILGAGAAAVVEGQRAATHLAQISVLKT